MPSVSRPPHTLPLKSFKDQASRPPQFLPELFPHFALITLALLFCIMAFREWARARRSRKSRNRLSLDAARAKSSHTPSHSTGPEYSGALAEYISEIWNSPPATLPGPYDHPFFAQFSGPPKSPQASVDANDLQHDRHAQGAPAGVQPDNKPPATIPPCEVIATPPVHPFVPAPTLAMEVIRLPTPPEDRPAVSLSPPGRHNPTSDKPQSEFARPLSSSASSHAGWTAERPPALQATETPRAIKLHAESASADQQPLPTATAEISTNCASQSAPSSPTDTDPPPLHYTRSVPNAEIDRQVYLHGQLWRAGNKNSGWRRNQWVVDIR
jgi:hypothetical protein